VEDLVKIIGIIVVVLLQACFFRPSHIQNGIPVYDSYWEQTKDDIQTSFSFPFNGVEGCTQPFELKLLAKSHGRPILVEIINCDRKVLLTRSRKSHLWMTVEDFVQSERQREIERENKPRTDKVTRTLLIMGIIAGARQSKTTYYNVVICSDGWVSGCHYAPFNGCCSYHGGIGYFQ
jgi:hypothetical protein